jgi:hypothetical protein
MKQHNQRCHCGSSETSLDNHQTLGAQARRKQDSKNSHLQNPLQKPARSRDSPERRGRMIAVTRV